jgi:hypothetical protein
MFPECSLQGMNFVAGLLLLHLDEAAAFTECSLNVPRKFPESSLKVP